MRFLMLQFNHGVEIGAYLAYVGYYRVTKNEEILKIAQEEVEHKRILKEILNGYGRDTSKLFDSIFTIIGYVVITMCYISPKWLLNKVAKSLEVFAVFSYNILAEKFPEKREVFLEMADTEKRYEEYFS